LGVGQQSALPDAMTKSYKYFAALALSPLALSLVGCQQTPPPTTQVVTPAPAPAPAQATTSESTTSTHTTEVKPGDPTNPDTPPSKVTTTDTTTTKKKM